MTSEKTSEPWLLREFEASRPRLQAVAQRMLASRAEAEDALQEAWLRLSRADASAVENLRGWLTTLVARICLDMLRARKARREEVAEAGVEELSAPASGEPGHEQALADSVGAALLLVLDTLTPNERLAFVLHDSFDLPFEEIANVLGVTPVAARKLASRARQRVRGGSATADEEPDPSRQREVVEAFLMASRTGDLAGLLRVLHPEVVLRADSFAVAEAERRRLERSPYLVPETRGAQAVADAFNRRANAARPAWIDGRVGAVWAPQDIPRAAFVMSVENERIVSISIVAAPEELAKLRIVLDDADPGAATLAPAQVAAEGRSS